MRVRERLHFIYTIAPRSYQRKLPCNFTTGKRWSTAFLLRYAQSYCIHIPHPGALQLTCGNFDKKKIVVNPILVKIKLGKLIVCLSAGTDLCKCTSVFSICDHTQIPPLPLKIWHNDNYLFQFTTCKIFLLYSSICHSGTCQYFTCNINYIHVLHSSYHM